MANVTIGTVSPIRALIDELETAGLAPTGEEIADAIWLAVKIIENAVSLPHRGSRVEPLARREDTHQVTGRSDTAPTTEAEAGAAPTISDGDSPLFGGVPGLADSKRHGIMPVSIPAGEALAGKAAIGRALRPLSRKLPSRSRRILDVEATVNLIANSDCRIFAAAYRPKLEPWFEVALVADASPSMAPWATTARELQTLLERNGAFRTVHTFHLRVDPESDGPTISVAGDPRRNIPVSSLSVINPSGNRVILILTDAAGAHWRNGEMSRLLFRWSDTHPVTVIHVLPRHLWIRTAVGVP